MINQDKLHILWTTDNKDTILNMLSIYAINSKRHHWWKEVNVILWGASVRLVGYDTQVQTEVLEMLQNGLTVEACKDCCETFEVVETMNKLGVNVKYLGESLTAYIKSGEKVLTF